MGCPALGCPDEATWWPLGRTGDRAGGMWARPREPSQIIFVPLLMAHDLSSPMPSVPAPSGTYPGWLSGVPEEHSALWGGGMESCSGPC